jgi:hypothetical protein
LLRGSFLQGDRPGRAARVELDLQRVGQCAAERYATTLRPILIELSHMPVEKIADELTKRKVETPRGGRWHGRTVARLLDRLGLR